MVEDEVREIAHASGQIARVQTRVVREDAGGTLDFYYRITVESSIEQVNIFALVAGPDVDYRLDGLGEVGPGGAQWLEYPSARGPDQPSQWAISFNFFPPVVTPTDSRFFFVKTTTTEYVDGVPLVLDGGRTLPVFGPS